MEFVFNDQLLLHLSKFFMNYSINFFAKTFYSLVKMIHDIIQFYFHYVIIDSVQYYHHHHNVFEAEITSTLKIDCEKIYGSSTEMI